MFRRILVPLDGSENSERVLPWVKRYAGRDRAQAVLLQVVPREYPMKGLPFASESGEPKEYLGRIERDLNYAGIPVRMLLRSGDVARTIVAVAEQEVCDLVAISSRGASKIARWLMGGITQQVVRRSQVPLLIVRARPAPGRDRHPRRILVPLDGSDVAESILPWSAQLARFHRAQALLLHVRHRTPGRILHPRQSSGDYSARLSRLCDR
ncbi:MAG: universal stress protein, partial [Planctomycetes bacterium]|nr:universal stress protein [Planctomycetota bacterium]